MKLEELLEETAEAIELIEGRARSWQEISYEELEELIGAGRLAEWLDFQEKYAALVNEELAPRWLEALALGSAASTRGLIVLEDSMTDVITWLKIHGGRLISDLSLEAKKAVSNLIVGWQAQLMNPHTMARQIRPLIGLTERQALANARYRAQVYETLKETGLKASEVARRADRAALKMASKQHRYRAETILHTELALAYNQGADMGVRRAISQGIMSPCQMIWRTAGTNRVCARCLDLKDHIVGTTDESGVQLPPLHPRCRCTIEYLEMSQRGR